MIRKIALAICLSAVTIAAHAHPTYEIEPKGQTIALVLGQEIVTNPDGVFICTQRVLFFSFKKGRTFCTHGLTDTVFQIKNGSKNIPSDMYFSLPELYR